MVGVAFYAEEAIRVEFVVYMYGIFVLPPIENAATARVALRHVAETCTAHVPLINIISPHTIPRGILTLTANY